MRANRGLATKALMPPIAGALQRAVELEAPGLVVEFETLPPMTENPPTVPAWWCSAR